MVGRDNTRRRGGRAVLQNLQTYPEPYVTIGQLARYWLISRKQLYKQVEAGSLKAIRLGPRLLRIRTSDALDFENSARFAPPGSAALGLVDDIREQPATPPKRR